MPRGRRISIRFTEAQKFNNRDCTKGEARMLRPFEAAELLNTGKAEFNNEEDRERMQELADELQWASMKGIYLSKDSSNLGRAPV